MPDPVDLDPLARREFAQPLADLRATQFRFFQFYGNTAVALCGAVAVVLYRTPAPTPRGAVAGLCGFLFVEWILLTSARSCLQKYRTRLAQFRRPASQVA